jgi:hypothetical protein
VTNLRPVRSVGVTMRIAALLCGLALIAAAGCGGDDDESGAAGGGGGAQTGGSARLADTIKFEVVGGDAFRSDVVTVSADGGLRIKTRSGEHSAKLDSDELSELAAAVQRAGLATAQSAVTEPPAPDALSYRFTYRGRAVTTDDPALPERLRPLVGELMTLIDEHGA